MDQFINRIVGAYPGKTMLFSVGQAGYIIKTASGKLLGIDLYLSDCVERLEGHIGFKRMLPKLLSPYDIEFDYLIATHPHFDHFDYDSIPELMSNGRTKLFASVECAKLVNDLKMTNKNITYVKPGENCDLADITIHFINCDHGTGAPDAVGVIIEADGKLIFEAGDTCLRLDRADEYSAWGKIDVMIAPINGAYGNMNEEDCVRLSETLKPGLTIPCHYGMFASHGGDPGRFIELMNNICPRQSYIIMTHGEGIEL